VLGCLACHVAAIDEPAPDWIDTADRQFASKLQGTADTIDRWRAYVAAIAADEDWD
jgi:cytochrome c551/c552